MSPRKSNHPPVKVPDIKSLKEVLFFSKERFHAIIEPQHQVFLLFTYQVSF